jgi:hypothetical protein
VNATGQRKIQTKSERDLCTGTLRVLQEGKSLLQVLYQSSAGDDDDDDDEHVLRVGVARMMTSSMAISDSRSISSVSSSFSADDQSCREKKHGTHANK